MSNRVEIGKLSNYSTTSDGVEFTLLTSNSSNNTTGKAFEVKTAGTFQVSADINIFFFKQGSPSSTSRATATSIAANTIPDNFTFTFQKSTDNTNWTTFSTQTITAVFSPSQYTGTVTTNSDQYGVRVYDPKNLGSPYTHSAKVSKHNENITLGSWGLGLMESDAMGSYGNGYYANRTATSTFSTGTNYIRVQLSTSDTSPSSSTLSDVQNKVRRYVVSPVGSAELETNLAGTSGTSYGLRISKSNVDVTNCRADQVLFDSRFNRTGGIYGGGFSSSISTTSTTGFNFKGSKTELAYIPLVWATEDKQGSTDTMANSNNVQDYADRINFYTYTKTNIIPSQIFSNVDAYGANSYATQTGRNKITGGQCQNLNLRVLKIPNAYGYMTSAYFGDGTSNSTNRVVIGKHTNSNAGLSNARGVFVSRKGKDVATCTDDELIFNTDQGGSTSLTRGLYQTMTVNLNDVVNNNAEPTSVAVVSNITTSNSPQISYSVPYSFTPPTGYKSIVPTVETTTQTNTGSSSANTFDIGFAESLNTSTGISTITLSTTTSGVSLEANFAPVRFDSQLTFF